MCEGKGDGCLLTGAPLERQKRWDEGSLSRPGVGAQGKLRVRARLQMGGPAGQLLSSTGCGASRDLRPDLEALRPQVAGDMLLSCELSRSMLFRWMPNRRRSGPVLEESTCG